MAGGRTGAVLRDIQTLFDTGTASGLSDRQLLEQFLGRRDAAAEVAFEVLVLRHGPMVLRVCHNVLGDAADAEDAFQATFLVLVRRSGSIRRLESLGSWLYGVACRVAARARVEATRRRAAERRGGLRVVQAVDPPEGRELDSAEFGPVIQEEVRRLPEKFRAVVVLCYWEGLTQEQAAKQLGCPLGTVRSRLARARERLHRRLIRRGVVPVAVAAALDSSSASAAVSALPSRLSPVAPELVHSTIRAAVRVAAGQAPAQVVSGVAAALVQKALRSMTMVKIGKLMTVLCLAGMFMVGASFWEQQPDDQRPRPRPRTAVQQKARSTEDRKSGPAPVVAPPDLVIVEVLDALPGRPITGERLVRPDGTISLGFYGEVHVAGLTLPEIKARVVQHLRKYLTDLALGLTELDSETGQPVIDPKTGEPKMIDPKDSEAVFVDVTAYNSGIYYVEGDVRYSGRFGYTGNENVLDVIHYAGGILPSADRSRIRLIRSFPRGSPAKVLPVDYEEISMGTDQSTNHQILPNDRLVVPRKSDNQSQKSSSPRAPESSPSRPDIGFVRTPSTAVKSETRLDSLRALERHFEEVEKKLDMIIEGMQPAKSAKQGRAAGNAGTEPGPRSTVDPEAEASSPFKLD